MVIVSAAAGARAAETPPPAAARCDRPASGTLIETRKVRVYALREEHQTHRKPTIASRPVFGCLKETGRSLPFGLPEVPDEPKALWVEVDSGVLAANGPRVAYAYTEYYLDTHTTWVRVRDLRTRVVIRSCFVGGGMAPHRLPRVTDIVLDPSGKVGWRVPGGEQGDDQHRQPGCDLMR